mgnify:CR=1 FL=1
MSDDTVTGWKTKALKLWALAVEHKDYAIPIAAFLIGWIVGKVL